MILVLPRFEACTFLLKWPLLDLRDVVVRSHTETNREAHLMVFIPTSSQFFWARKNFLAPPRPPVVLVDLQVSR